MTTRILIPIMRIQYAAAQMKRPTRALMPEDCTMIKLLGKCKAVNAALVKQCNFHQSLSMEAVLELLTSE